MAKESQFSLLKKRRFGPFFATQFLGAFNDNVFKNALIILLAFRGASELNMNSGVLINLSAGLFILPFFLFSATAGQLADKYDKALLIRRIKFIEILVMSLAAVGFLFGQLQWLILLLFVMGTQSAFFGPIKYGILPQHLDTDELVGGNGMVGMGTFLAILLGTMLGGFLIATNQGPVLVSAAVMVAAAAGYWASRAIPNASAPAPDLKMNWNPFTETFRLVGYARENRTVFLSVLGICWFWFFGSVVLAQLPNYAKFTLGGDEQVVTLLLTLFSVGVGVGSISCERLSGHRVELGLVPLGSIGLTVFMLDLYLANPAVIASGEPVLLGAIEFLRTPGNWRPMFDVVMIGVSGGLYIVPLYALIQQRSEPSRRSRIIAALNILNALFMVVAAVSAIGFLLAGFSIPQLFLGLAVLNALAALYIYTLVPEFLMRFLAWILINVMYRITKRGEEHLPSEGAALLVCNHVSFMDALVVAASVPRPARFVMYHKIFDAPILRFIFRTSKAIPIAGRNEDPELLERAYDAIAEELEAGQLVCIFPEGKITRDGEMNEFRKGVERIVQRTPVPVVPLALRGMWGSFFSRDGGKAMQRIPRRFFSKIEVAVGEPVAPQDVQAQALHDTVLGMRGDWK